MEGNALVKNKKGVKRGCSGGIIVLAVVLGVLLLVSVAVNVGLLANNNARNDSTSSIRGEITEMENKKLQVFDDIASSYIMEQDLTENGVNEWYQMTGYGISDEDDVFYITFQYTDYSGCGGANCDARAQYGVMYFWPSDSSMTKYSHAYSYHAEPYHPGGEYVEHRSNQ